MTWEREPRPPEERIRAQGPSKELTSKPMTAPPPPETYRPPRPEHIVIRKRKPKRKAVPLDKKVPLDKNTNQPNYEWPSP